MMVQIREAGAGALAAVSAERITSIYHHTPHGIETGEVLVRIDYVGAQHMGVFYTREPIADLVRRINVARSGNAFVAGPPEDGA